MRFWIVLAVACVFVADDLAARWTWLGLAGVAALWAIANEVRNLREAIEKQRRRSFSDAP